MLRHSHEKTGPFLLQITPSHRSVKYNTDLPPPSYSKLLLQVLSNNGLVSLATLIRGGGGITSTRSWTGHLCQNTVQCVKHFCNWLSHLRAPVRKNQTYRGKCKKRFSMNSLRASSFINSFQIFALTMV